MLYNRLGNSGLRVSALSFGSWLTFSTQLDLDNAKKCIAYALEQGINFFDTAEVYSQGAAETLLGEAIQDYRREDLVIATKLFWGGDGPNDTGLSRKHLLEGTYNSLERLNLEYVDLLYCHRPDENTPILETVRAMDYLVRHGYTFYWGTSEWSAAQLEEAYQLAEKYNCIPPTMEQPQYNMFHRQRVEQEYLPLYEKYGLGTTIWSPLASGVLTGKYKDGIPADSRMALFEQFKPEDLDRRIAITNELTSVAEKLDCSMAQLALAWCLKNPHVSTVILGASKISQLEDNIQALNVVEKLDNNVMNTINSILNNQDSR